MKIFITIVLALFLSACVEDAVLVKQLGCMTTTEEGRAEIRATQNLKTNICGDDLTK